MAAAQIGGTVGAMTNAIPQSGGGDPAGTAAADAEQSTFPWPPVLLAAALACAFLLGRYAPQPWPGLNDTTAQWIGLGFGVAGLILMVWAVFTLRRHATTVMPHRPSGVLVTSGPYWRLRNPIYLGEVFATLGLAELTKNIWYVAAALAFAVLVTALQIVHEERHLEARFGQAYRDYKARSRRWL